MTHTIPARYAAGYSLRQIAEQLDRDHTYVRQQLIAAGVAMRGRGCGRLTGKRAKRTTPAAPRKPADARAKMRRFRLDNRTRCLPALGYCPTLARLAPQGAEVSIAGSSFGASINSGGRRLPGMAR